MACPPTSTGTNATRIPTERRNAPASSMVDTTTAAATTPMNA
jgi:hypothetical protein